MNVGGSGKEWVFLILLNGVAGGPFTKINSAGGVNW